MVTKFRADQLEELAPLLLALLDGRPGALEILGDFLEEAGEPQAAWVRVQWTTDPLVVALECVPRVVAHSLLCDFAERLLPVYETYFIGDSTLGDAVATKRCHLAGGASGAEMEAAFEDVRRVLATLRRSSHLVSMWGPDRVNLMLATAATTLHALQGNIEGAVMVPRRVRSDSQQWQVSLTRQRLRGLARGV